MFRFLFLLCFISLSYAQSPSSFSQSKKIAAQLFQQHPQTIYCQCSYEDKEVNLASCSMQAADSIKRHIALNGNTSWLLSILGQQFAC